MKQYIIRRGCLSPELCARARDRIWACDSARRMRRDNPASCESSDPIWCRCHAPPL